MKIFTVFFKISLLGILMLLNGCADKEEDEMFSSPTQEKKINKFVLKTTSGEEIFITVDNPHKIKIDNDRYKNKIVLLDFWATWCPPCIQELPALQRISDKYKSDLAMIGVLAERSKPLKTLQAFVEKHKIKYAITSTHDGSANMDLFTKLTNLRTLPFKIIYDRNGTYVTHYYGAVSEDIISKAIEQVIAR